MLLKLSLGPILVLIIHVIASLTGWYESIFWLDTPMHFLGGLSIGISAYYFLVHSQLKNLAFNATLFEILTIISITALAAVSWETLEYNLDQIFGTVMQPSIRDTMKDLAFGLIGGTLASLLIFNKNKTAQ